MKRIAAATMVALATIDANAGEVDPSIYVPPRPDQFPRMVKNWGLSAFNKVNKLRKSAAIRVSKSADCDAVESVGFSEERSTKPDDLVVFVYCNNGRKFYIRQSDVDQSPEMKSVNAKTEAMNSLDMTNKCSEALQSKIPFPSTYSQKFLSNSEFRAPNGNVVITVAFASKNQYGAELPQYGKCYFDDRGLRNVEIIGR